LPSGKSAGYEENKWVYPPKVPVRDRIGGGFKKQKGVDAKDQSGKKGAAVEFLRNFQLGEVLIGCPEGTN